MIRVVEDDFLNALTFIDQYFNIDKNKNYLDIREEIRDKLHEYDYERKLKNMKWI